MAKRREPGEGTLRLRKDGRWEGRVVIGYDDKGLPKTKNVTAKTKPECEEKLERLKEEYFRSAEKIRADMPFGEWIDYWYQTFEKAKIRPTTQVIYENRIYDHIIPEIGKIPLNKLTQNDLQQFYARLKQNGRQIRTHLYGNGLSDSMVRSCHGSCRSALQKATEEGLIHTNPAIGCKLPPKKAKEMQVLTQAELQRFLLQAKEDGYYELFLLELSTGLRRGEILGLQWDDLKPETGELHIRRQATTVQGAVQINEPKTKASIRTIILPPAIVTMLLEYRKGISSRWMFPSGIKEDAPRHPSATRDALARTLKRAGCKHVRFHDLRHTFATLALANGMDIKTLSAIIGHTSAETTLNIYTHITDDMQRAAADKIERGFGKNSGSIGEREAEPDCGEKTPRAADFKPYTGKIRKPGTGGIYMINDHLYEGRFTPTNAYGERERHIIYAHTREECEEKLAERIAQVKAEIKAEKERLKKA